MAFHAHVARALEAAGREFERSMTKHLQADAESAGWSQDAAKSIKVHHNGGHVHVSHDGDDFEYGNEDRPPLAVTRQFVGDLQGPADARFEQILTRHLRGIL